MKGGRKRRHVKLTNGEWLALFLSDACEVDCTGACVRMVGVRSFQDTEMGMGVPFDPFMRRLMSTLPITCVRQPVSIQKYIR